MACGRSWRKRKAEAAEDQGGWFSSSEDFLRQSAGTEEQDVLHTWGQSVARLRGSRRG